MQRSQFNYNALKLALENDYTFMIEEILDGSVPVTSKIIELLLKEKQIKLLTSLISIPKSRLSK